MQYVLLYIKLLGFQVYSFWQNSVWHTTNMNGIFLQSFRPRRNTSRKQLTFNHHKTLESNRFFFYRVYKNLWTFMVNSWEASRQARMQQDIGELLYWVSRQKLTTDPLKKKKEKKNKQNQDQRHNITVTVLKNIFVKMSSNPWNDTCEESCHLPF